MNAGKPPDQPYRIARRRGTVEGDDTEIEGVSVTEFQRALTAVFEAGPAEPLEVKIDRLDGRAERSEPVPACGTCYCVEPVAAAAG